MPNKDPVKRKAYQRRYQLARYHRLRMATGTAPHETPERKAYMLNYMDANRPQLMKKQRDRERERLYGITPAQYQQMLIAQGFECPICTRLLAHPTKPAVDHSHATGAVRGILCRNCNAALGMLEDSAANLERAIAYLSPSRLLSLRRLLSGATSTMSSEPSSKPSPRPV